MTDDLRYLNRLIAKLWLGELDPEQENYIRFASVCVGHFAHTATELAQVLRRLRDETWNRHSVGELNRSYLAVARLAASKAAPDHLDMLLRLGLDLRQAEILRALSDPDVDRLAFGISGPIVRFASQTFRRGVALHAQASRQHATALVAASTQSGSP